MDAVRVLKKITEVVPCMTRSMEVVEKEMMTIKMTTTTTKMMRRDQSVSSGMSMSPSTTRKITICVMTGMMRAAVMVTVTIT